jgi:hypothetical protein
MNIITLLTIISTKYKKGISNVHLNCLRHTVREIGAESNQDVATYQKKSTDAFSKKQGWCLAGMATSIGSLAALEAPAVVALLATTGPAGTLAVGSVLLVPLIQSWRVTLIKYF